MATNNQKTYRAKLQGVVKKINDAIRDVESVTMTNVIDSKDRRVLSVTI